MKRFVAAAALLLVAATAQAERGLVVGVTDGDTVKVVLHGVQTTIRLYGIDTPEKKQAYGQAAREYTADLVARQEVDVEPIAVDRYGRTVAIVMVGDQCLQEQLLTAGYAWVYDQYCNKPFCHGWTALQQLSAMRGAGLWQDANPVPPWQWRKHH
jgi:endonuclease YncB( thermonuclease family)